MHSSCTNEAPVPSTTHVTPSSPPIESHRASTRSATVDLAALFLSFTSAPVSLHQLHRRDYGDVDGWALVAQ